jgi:hypothetical protein
MLTPTLWSNLKTYVPSIFVSRLAREVARDDAREFRISIRNGHAERGWGYMGGVMGDPLRRNGV